MYDIQHIIDGGTDLNIMSIDLRFNIEIRMYLTVSFDFITIQ